jgi:hypothetical protein
MASIEERASEGDERRMRGFFVTTVNYIRLVVLMVGEVVKELYQAERQRGWAVEPRMRRDLHFAIERAATNIALRTVSTALVIEEMYGGAPAIYVDYTGYDAISHHCGPERPEAIDALAGIDRAIGSLLKAARFTGRPYRMVVLSDHGQCLGAPFQQRFGQSLEAVIAEQLPREMVVVGTTDSVESAGIGRRIAAEFGRGSGLGPLVARHMPSALRRTGGQGHEQGRRPASRCGGGLVREPGPCLFHGRPRPDDERRDRAAPPGPDRDPCAPSGDRSRDRRVGGRPHARARHGRPA